ncbi:hypothetical protein F5Y09DRAFT_351321 [Xylaria sp. FL1042]|nr:hypothetical protein F5Y09DRAFT_351321 [Xylaria sp. FL1042]
MYQSTTHLGIFPIVFSFWVCLLLVLGQSHIDNDGTHLIASYKYKKSTASSPDNVSAVTEMVTLGSDMLTTSSYNVVVVVTMTTIETINVEPVAADIDAPNSTSTFTAASGGSVDDQHETVTATYTPVVIDTGTSNDDPAGTTSTGKASLFVYTKTPPRHPISTSLAPRSMDKGNVTTTFVVVTLTITSTLSSSPSTSSFNEAICDDIYCNTDGNKICIYWAGVTSWDVSRGPMPGERPTVIGTC